jgi:hypothetical protein
MIDYTRERMGIHQITADDTISASAERVYGIIADYRNGHPHIVPQPPFGAIEVEQGGVGAGTVIRFPMRVLGRTHTMRAVISEPEPGRVLVESYLESGDVTTFTVEPLDDGRRCRVTITTDLTVRGGPLGFLQRVFVTRYLRGVYARELRQLAEFAGRNG